MDSLAEPLDLSVADLAGEEDWFAPCVWVVPSRLFGIVALGYRDGMIRGGWGRDIDDAVEVISMPDPPILVPWPGQSETGADRATAEQVAGELAKAGVLAVAPKEDSEAPLSGVALSQWAWQVWLLVIATAAVGGAAYGLVFFPVMALGLLAFELERLGRIPATRLGASGRFGAAMLFLLALVAVGIMFVTR